MKRSFTINVDYSSLKSISEIWQTEVAKYHAKHFVENLIESDHISRDEGRSLIKMILSEDKDSRDLAYDILKHQYNYEP